MSNWLNARARRSGFSLTVGVLLACLVVFVPVLQVHNVLDAMGVARRGRRWYRVLVAGVYGIGLWAFWGVGRWVPMVEIDEMYWWGGE